ncbi:MAG: cell division protein ZapE [Hyphomicrobiales bacterium]
MPNTVCTRYYRWVEDGRIESDPAQRLLLERFVALNEQLKSQELASKKSSLGWLFAKSAPRQNPKGLYIWGGVGRGKTMLMDLFYDTSPVRKKKRFHFHAFMADVHDRIHKQRQDAKSGNAKDGDPIPPVADAISQDLQLLCFDEFYVVDIADAMILGRLFERFFKNGVTLVATSNVKPDELYPDGLNRELFLPFISLLQERVDVVKLEARTDFRLEKLSQAKTYFTPLGDDASKGLDLAWSGLTGSITPGVDQQIQMKGRTFTVPQVSQGVARASFDDLCNKPLGASDYLVIARLFHTLILDDVPTLSRESANAARRFINLVDALYDHRTKLVISAAETPDMLYSAKSGNELFAFDRTASRLIEMQSMDYLAQPHGSPVEVSTAHEVKIA